MPLHARAILFLSAATTVLLFGLASQRPAITQGQVDPPGPSDLPLSGWLWVGNGTNSFISFCGGQGTSRCPGTVNYQVIIDNSTGEFRGYAFLGIQDAVTGDRYEDYLSFNKSETGTPPEPPFNNSNQDYIAFIDPTTTGVKKMEGWGRFMSACDKDSNGRCTSSGPGVNSGGWDGWVRFSEGVAQNGTAYPGFIATSDGVDGFLTGYGWGGDVVGWIAAKTGEPNYEPPPQTTLPRVDVLMTANPTSGNAPLKVRLTATVTSNSVQPITYTFDCDTDPNGPNTQETSFSSTEKTASFDCDYDTPDNYHPFVTVYQGGVFARAEDSSEVTNIGSGQAPEIVVRRGIIREIAPDE